MSDEIVVMDSLLPICEDGQHTERLAEFAHVRCKFDVTVRAGSAPWSWADCWYCEGLFRPEISEGTG